MELVIIIVLNFLTALSSVLTRLSSPREPEQLSKKKAKQEKVKPSKKKRIITHAIFALPFIIFIISSYLTIVQIRKNQVTTKDKETIAQGTYYYVIKGQQFSNNTNGVIKE